MPQGTLTFTVYDGREPHLQSAEGGVLISTLARSVLTQAERTLRDGQRTSSTCQQQISAKPGWKPIVIVTEVQFLAETQNWRLNHKLNTPDSTMWLFVNKLHIKI